MDCTELFNKGEANSGIYVIKPNQSEPFNTYCEMGPGKKQSQYSAKAADHHLLHLKSSIIVQQTEVQLSSNAGLKVQWILTRHGKNMKKDLEIWKVSQFCVFNYKLFQMLISEFIYQFESKEY